MRDNVSVPKTNAGRESQTKIWLWFTWLDAAIIILFVLVPIFCIVFCTKISGWWILLSVGIGLIISVFITYPFSGVKIYYFLWDAMFRWGMATKKKYTKEEANKSFSYFNEDENLEPHIKSWNITTKNEKRKKYDAFYEISSNDISLANESEIEIYLAKFESLFKLTEEVNISLVKIDWNYNFNKNIKWLTDNYKEWTRQGCTDEDYKKLNIYEKVNEVNNIQNSKSITQKRYFLIINATNLEKIRNCFELLQSDLYEAGLNVKPADKAAVNACVNKLTPSNGISKSIAFKARYYVADDTKYYRTLIITTLPKTVGAFWNQEIFNLEDCTIQMQMKSLDATASSFNKDPVKRYVTRLNSLATDRKARNIVEAAEKEHEISSIADLAEDVANGDEKIKIVKYLITFSASSKSALKLKEKKVRAAISKAKMKVNFCTCKQWDAYRANLPFFEEILEKECNMMLSSSCLTLSYPFTYSDYLDEKGDLYGYKLNGSNPILIDFTKVDDKVNMWNTFLFGKTGGGKTTAVKKILRNFIINPKFRKIFLIDPENEYTNAVKNFGGDVIDCSGLTAKSGKINPFQIFNAGDEEGERDNQNSWQQHFFFLEEFFDGLYVNSLDEETKSILLDIVAKTYEAKKIYPISDFRKIKNNQWPIFSDVVKQAKQLLMLAKKNPLKSKYKLSSLEQIYYPLSQFAEGNSDSAGVFSSLWNGYTNIKLDNRIISFNIQKLNKSGVPQRIKTTQIRLLLRFIEDACIENKEYNERLNLLWDDENCYHTAVFCDEFHLLINKKFTAPLEWFYGFIKRIRKYKGRCVLITQNINDMVSDNEIIRLTTGIINSCQFMFIFKLLANDITNLNKLLAEIGGLKSEEITFLKTGEQGQAIFVSGNDTHIKMKFLWGNNLEYRILTNNLLEIQGE